MAGRRVQPEVQKIFEKYVDNDLHVRRLDHISALKMLEIEFNLSPKGARSIVLYYDADQNGFFSLWEFQHFYNTAGPRVSEIEAEFERLDSSKSGFLDEDTMVNVLKSMRSADDKELEDKDIEMIMKSAKDVTRISLGDYIAILFRIKLYKKGR